MISFLIFYGTTTVFFTRGSVFDVTNSVLGEQKGYQFCILDTVCVCQSMCSILLKSPNNILKRYYYFICSWGPGTLSMPHQNCHLELKFIPLQIFRCSLTTSVSPFIFLLEKGSFSTRHSWNVLHNLERTVLKRIDSVIISSFLENSSLKVLNSHVPLSRTQKQFIDTHHQQDPGLALHWASHLKFGVCIVPSWCYCAELMNSLQTSIPSMKVDGHPNYALFRFHSYMAQILLFCQISKGSWHFRNLSKSNILKSK